MSTPAQAIAPNEHQISSGSSAPAGSLVRLEQIGKLIVLATALIYGIGIVVANSYLMTIGVSDFSALKPKYVLTGLWASLILFSCGLPIIIPITAISRKRLAAALSNSKAVVDLAYEFAGWAIIGVLFCVVGWFGLLVILGGSPRDIYAHREDARFLVNLFFWGIPLGVATYYVHKHTDSQSFHFVLDIVFFGISIFIPIVSLGVGFYPRVPEAMGGGKPTPATLLFNANGVAFWRQTGAIMPGDKEPMSSGSVRLLYQNDKELVVKAQYQQGSVTKEKIVVVSKTLVDGMILNPAVLPRAADRPAF